MDPVQTARGMGSAIEAVEFAMGMEKDAILYYSAILQSVAPEDKEAIAAIVKYEQLHLEELNALRDELKS